MILLGRWQPNLPLWVITSPYMRVELLRSLVAVLRAGSMRRAAADLFVTQPALTQRLGLLERELGVVLLLRSRAGVLASPTAERLMDRIQALIAAEDALLREAKEVRESMPLKIRIGAVGTAMRLLIPTTIVPFQKANPHIDIELMEELPSFDLLRGLRERTLDVAIIATFSDEDPPSDLVCESILRLPIRVGIPEGHPLLQLRSVAARDLLRHRLILPSSGLLMHTAALRLFAGRQPDIVTTDTVGNVRTMIAGGAGVGLLPLLGDGTEDFKAGIRYRPLDAAIPDVTFHIAYLSSKESAGRNELIRHLQAAAQRLTTTSTQGSP